MLPLKFPASLPHQEEEHRKKRVRKGTRSCWECKRRKVKCVFSSEEISVCTGCLARGTSCVSQEFPEEHDSASGNANAIGERLGRVELLLDKLVSKIESYEKVEECDLPSPDKIGTDVFTPSQHVNAPVLSLFDNVMITHRNVAPREPEQSIPTPSSVHSGAKTPQYRFLCKNERIRSILAELLPSQRDANLISSESASLLVIHSLSVQYTNPTSQACLHEIFNMAEVARQHPTFIARSLLYLAVSIQQLPMTFDFSQLSLAPSPEARIEKYMTTVQALVNGDDELMCSMLGLECLFLQGLYHTNAGSLRRAWLAFRRALNIAQLLGFHRRNYADSPNAVPGAPEMWHHIVQADRFLGLLLGLPFGSADDAFGPHETLDNPDMDKDDLYNRNLSIIAGRVMERNQSEYPYAFATTQEIDEKLENLARQMPPSWWEIPPLPSSDQTPAQMMELFDRLMSHFWHFQLEALLHLPFMLRASTERRYEYSKFSCLKASREMIYRYLFLRNSPSGTFCCKVIDFSTFTAAITIFLTLLEPGQRTEPPADRQRRESDQALIQAVVDSMDKLSAVRPDLLASQCADVIRTLLAIQNSPNRSSNLRLTIPYFGTISITCTPQASSSPSGTSKTPTSISSQPTDVNNQVSDQVWPSGELTSVQNPLAVPIVSFTSSQFPPGDPLNNLESWRTQETENMHFDGLLNMDIETNWVYPF